MSRARRWHLRTTSPEGVVVGPLDAAPAPARGGGAWRWVAVLAAVLVALATVLLVNHLRSGGAPWSPAQPRIDVQRAAELPEADLGWVRMRDHFTVTIGAGAGQGVALGDLLVVADTTLAAHASFPQHRHAGIEVVNLVLDGTLTVEEGGRGVELAAGDVQVIAAGAGMIHTEANHGGQPVRVLQLWLASRDPDHPPAEEHKAAVDGTLPLRVLRPDVQVRRVSLAPGHDQSWTIAKGRVAYVICVGGSAEVDTARLDDGDGATLIDGSFVARAVGGPARLFVVELPAPAALR